MGGEACSTWHLAYNMCICCVLGASCCSSSMRTPNLSHWRPLPPQALCRISGQRVALKLYDHASLCSMGRAQLAREVRLHSAAYRHPHIIRLFAVFTVGAAAIVRRTPSQHAQHVCVAWPAR